MPQIKTISQNQYPIIYEGGKETAVVIDIETFQQINLILENLLNREAEPEDELIAATHALWQRMIQQAKTAEPATDWVTELYDL